MSEDDASLSGLPSVCIQLSAHLHSVTNPNRQGMTNMLLSNLTEGGVSDVVAINVKGLLNVVPSNGASDKARDYCINGFAIDNYSSLLVTRQLLRPSQVVVPLFDDRARRWLLLQVDLRRRCMYVYDSLPPSKARDKHDRKMLVDRAVKISSLPRSPLMSLPQFSYNHLC
ncbi:hypothetical protein Cgig2_007092 [Carnegiea gigantea]|uniref:Uncharacterized protein n=1 Tax=Carnegiea gigantea TaxID=171969 RepID=A0A9Q1JSC8_9CARY|nr:hypothetical protein Cgig2_007092 [Carnegiea gigantea]